MKTTLQNHLYFSLLLAATVYLAACTDTTSAETRTIAVTATAYNSLETQTKAGDPKTAAWGDQLEPGMKAIAVSRDLLEQEGFEYNTEVKIEGLPGTYKVLDKMNKRWTNRIDIYMGEEIEEAKAWGKQEVTISWEVDS